LASSLTISSIDAGYGSVRVLSGVSLNVGAGETVALLGTNGNGKSTLMKSVMGIVRPFSGSIAAEIDGVAHELVGKSTEEIVDLGIGFVPEGRRLFPKLTVTENLLIDEPSVGLAPLLVSRTIDKIRELKVGFNLTVLMAEQNFTQAIRIADRGYVIVHGRIAFTGESAEALNNNDLIREFYLGA